ncbi:hypothetical protein [Sphingomonas sp.]
MTKTEPTDSVWQSDWVGQAFVCDADAVNSSGVVAELDFPVPLNPSS